MSLEDIRDADFENQWWPQSVPVHRSRQCWINTGHEPAFPFAEYRERERISVRPYPLCREAIREPDFIEQIGSDDSGSLHLSGGEGISLTPAESDLGVTEKGAETECVDEGLREILESLEDNARDDKQIAELVVPLPAPVEAPRMEPM